jgi:hypothetical protein
MSVHNAADDAAHSEDAGVAESRANGLAAAGGGGAGGAAKSEERWSEAHFEGLRRRTDPEAEEFAAAYRRAHPELADARSLVRSLIAELRDAKEKARAQWAGGGAPDIAPETGSEGDNSGLLHDFGFDAALPEWGRDAELLRRGQDVFRDHGLYQSAALFFAALPMAYAEVSSAKVLAGVSDLATGNLTRRVAETGQMLIDVMGLRGPGTLEPGSPGHATAVGLRLLHAFVRVLVLETGEWDADRYGPPVNQELLLATLIDFSVVTWEAMERLGVDLTPEQRAANLYIWSVFGHLMGVEVCRDGPLTLDDLEPINAHLGRRLEPSEEGRRLMGTLLAEMENFMYLGWRKVPRSLIHWLFRDGEHGTDRVPHLLGVPPPAWWATALFAISRAAHRRAWPDPIGPAVRWLIRKAGRYVIVAYADRYSGGQAPFRIPAETARALGVRSSPLAQGVRSARRRARRAVRAALGR